MKRLIVLLIILFFGSHAIGQISQANIENARSYVLTKVVYEYLREASPKKNKLKNFNIIKPKLESNTISAPLPVDTLSKLLDENDFINTKTEFVDKSLAVTLDQTENPAQASKSLISQIYTIAYTSLKTKGIDNIKEQLEKDVEGLLGKEPAKQQQQKVVQPETKQQSATDEKEPKSDFWTFKLNFWSHLLPIIIVLLFLIICLSRIARLNERIERRKEEIAALSNKSFIGGQDRDLSRLEKKVEDMRYTVSLLQNDIDFLKKVKSDNITPAPQRKETTPGYTTTESNFSNANANVATKQVEPSVFYMGSPLDTFFPKNSRSNDYKKGYVLYKFYQMSNPNEAHFEFISDDETIRHIRSNSMEIVNPACVSQNSPTTNTNSVKTLTKGFARYENDRWNIIDKALIKFE